MTSKRPAKLSVNHGPGGADGKDYTDGNRASHNEQGIRVGPDTLRHGYQRPPAKGVLHFRAFPWGVPLAAGQASTIEQGVLPYRTCVGAVRITTALVARFGTALS